MRLRSKGEKTFDLKPKWFTHIHIHSHTYVILLNHGKIGYLIGVCPRRGDVLSDRIHTLHALQHKRAEQQYYGVH